VSDSELQEKYTVLVKNKFQVLTGESNGTKYEKFAQANKETMEECLPQKVWSGNHSGHQMTGWQLPDRRPKKCRDSTKQQKPKVTE
jgi:hypothetical protein